MSETAEPPSQGTYDDVPDEHVATVLNVPLRLSDLSATDATPTGTYPSQLPPGQGRHRKPDPPAEVPPERVAPPRAAAPLPPPRRRTTRAQSPVPSAPAYRESHTHWRATLKVGAISAAIVFGAAALTLVVLTWLP